ncbi:MAG: aminopeptidase P family protein [Pseudomonadota bacterium]
MFQTFEPVSDRSFGAKHLPLIRKEMEKRGIDAFIVPHDDEYQNEYIPAYAERLMWATGFSGSAGAAVIFSDRAVIFTDGRYTLQVRQQTDGALFDYVDITEAPLDAWLAQHARKGERIGYDPLLHTVDGLRRIEKAAKKAGFELTAVMDNPIDAAWPDQPPYPKTPAKPHPEKFAGVSSSEKRAQIAQSLKDAGAEAVLITAPPSIAWLFNIRGGDVARTPLPLSRAVLNSDGTAKLFIAPEKVDNALPEFLGPDVDILGPEQLSATLQSLGEKKARVSVDPSLAASKFHEDLKAAGAQIVEMTDPCAIPRAQKNTVEVEGAKAAHVRDGAAVTRFLHWLDTEAQTGDVDEITAAQKLESFRAEHHDLRDLSFDSISGAGPNGAICHYRVSTETNAKLKPGSLFLIDSGGQYPDGTTDITRTAPIGEPTDEMRNRFTRVLKGHISLATLRFPEGTTGHQVDAFARRPLWDAGLDYDHGTGHGVGSFLGVHEGPQRIAKAVNTQALLPGMILSNEPGFYKEGAFGIRIENLIVVKKAQTPDGGDRAMLEFETMTMAPINLDLVDASLLSDDERGWLNAYHQSVREQIMPLVPADVQAWLKDATRAI